MMPEEKINELATEIAKSYAVTKTFCSEKEFVEMFLDMRDLAKKMIVKREYDRLNGSNIPDSFPEDVEEDNSRTR